MMIPCLPVALTWPVLSPVCHLSVTRQLPALLRRPLYPALEAANKAEDPVLAPLR
jgi:hypothetical protein